MSKVKFFLGLALVFSAQAPLLATAYTWGGGDSNNVWTDDLNWTPMSGYPGSGGSTVDTATFSSGVTGGATISLTTPITLAGYTSSVIVGYGLSGSAITFANNSTITTSVGSSTTLGISNPIAVAGNLNITLNNSEILTFSGALTASSGSLTVGGSGAGSVVFSGINSGYTGTITLNGGSLSIGSISNWGSNIALVAGSAGTLICTGSVTFPSNSTPSVNEISLPFGSLSFSVPSFDNITFNNLITGTGGTLEAVGAGTVILAGTSSGFWNLSVNGALGVASTVQMNAASLLTSGGTVSLAHGSTLKLNGFSQTTGGLSSTDSSTVVSLGSATLTISNSGVSSSCASQITGTGSLVKTGTGSLTLSSTTSNYSGGTMLELGTLSIGSANALGSGTLAISSSGVLSNTTSLSLNIPITVSGTSFVSPFTGTTFTLENQIGGSGTLAAIGAGVLTLSDSSNNYSGGTAIENSGTLSIGLPTHINDAASPGLTFGSNGVGGTLKPSAGMTLVEPVTLGSGGGTINTNGTSLVLSGQITGSGSLTKSGTGTVTFSYNGNNYSGATTVSTGSLQAGSAGGFSPSSAITVSGGTLDLNGHLNTISSLAGASGSVTSTSGAATLTINGSASELFQGTIVNTVGAFGLTIEGSSTLQLSNAGGNTYSGATTIAGTSLLQATAANAFSPNSSVSITGGTLSLNGHNNTISNLSGGSTTSVTLGTGQLTIGNANGSYDGVISDSSTGGNLVLQGTGIFSLSNANTYIGGTTVSTSGGAVELNALNATLGSGPINLDNGTSLNTSFDGISVANQINLSGSPSINVTTGTTTLTGNFSGGTFLSLPGSGKLVLNGSAYNTGAIQVTGGELAVRAPLVADVTVASGATLSGTSTITGAVTVYGNFAPGASIGTFAITGPYIQEAGSNYTNEIYPIGAAVPQVTDLFNITGNLEISPTATFTVDPLSGQGSFATGSSYTVITYTGALTGEFQAPVLTTSPLLVGSAFLSYSTPGIVTLTLGSPTPVNSIVSTGNGGKVANALDIVFNSGSGALNAIHTSIVSLTAAQISFALNQMQPSLYKGISIVQENNAVSVQGALSQRFQIVLDNAHCFVAKGDASDNREAYCESQGQIEQGLESCREKVDNSCESLNKPWHVWVSAIGDFLHQSSEMFYGSPQVGYQDDTGGAVTGFDYNFLGSLYAGGLAAYTGSYVKWQQYQGYGRINSAYGGLYFSAIGKLFYGNLSLIGAWNGYREQRNIIYTGTSLSAKNSHQGQQLISHFDTGLNFGFKGITIRPFDSLDWIVQREDSFKEHGAGEWDLAVNNTRANMLRNELGLNFAACRCFHGTKTTFDAKASWVREVRMSGKDTQAAFAAADLTKFIVIGYFPNRNLFSLGGSISVLALKDLLTCTVYYNGTFGHKYSDNGVGAEANFGF